MATQVNVREIILETLLLITRDGEYSHIALKNVLDKYQYLEKRERAFITRVVEGTLEHQIEIDYIINQFSKVKVHKQKPVIRTILRSSVYQLKYMDHVPDSAVCNEAVKLAGKKGFVNLKGFVNGVLRNISRNLDMVSYPDPSNEIACLSVRYSLPMWMVKYHLGVESVSHQCHKQKLRFLFCVPRNVQLILYLGGCEALYRQCLLCSVIVWLRLFACMICIPDL